MSKKVQHVINSSSGKWILRDGSPRKSDKTFSTQKQAIDYGVKACKKGGSQLLIHRKDGTIIERRSYNSPSPNSKVDK